MGGLFEFFSANPFFLLIIIFIVARFLFAGNKPQANQNKSEQQGKKPTLRSLLEEALNEGNVEKSKQVIEEKEVPVRNMTQQPVADAKKVAAQQIGSMERAQEEQLERFKNKYQPVYDNDDTEDAIHSANKMASQLTSNIKSDEDIHQDLDLKVTQKKLMESIIMAEVLGPPRALNRYENIALRRRK